MRTIAILTTTGSSEQARRIAAALVERRLAACVQISAIESCYRWQGRLHSEPEHRLLIKTVDARYADVEATIRELHDYELPAIVAFRFDRGFAPYEAWVSENCTADTD